MKPWMIYGAFVLALVVYAAVYHFRPEPIEAVQADAGPPPLGPAVLIDQSSVLLLQLRGPDFEEARGRGCPLEAFVEAQDAGYPVLRFRCTTYGAP